MAHSLYLPAREGFLAAEIDWNAPTSQKAALVRNYTFNQAHRTIADFKAASGIIVREGYLSGTTVTDAIADANDVTFASVPAGDPITGILVFQSPLVNGVEPADSAKRLIFYSNEFSNLPITPNGGDLVVSWDNDPAPGIFAL